MGKDSMALENQVQEWFIELYLHPDFFDEMNLYQKDKVYHHCLGFYSSLRNRIINYAFTQCREKIEGKSQKDQESFLNKLMQGEKFYSDFHKAKTIFAFFDRELTNEGNINRRGSFEKPQPKSKEIKIDAGVLDTLFKGLKPYFDKSEHNKLEKVLKGETLLEKLNFREQQNQLADIFFRLHKKEYLKNRTKTKEWLVRNFKYLHLSGHYKPCNPSSIADSLNSSKPEKRPSNDKAIGNKIDLLKT